VTTMENGSIKLCPNLIRRKCCEKPWPDTCYAFLLLLIVGLFLLSGCPLSSRQVPTQTDPAGESCFLVPGRPAAGGQISVSLFETVNPDHIPYPENESEEMVFTQLYESLVQIDCAGVVSPGIALRWTADPAGKRWEFTLDRSLKFSDGSQATGTDIALAWAESEKRAGLAALGYPWALIDSLKIIDAPEPKLVVWLAEAGGLHLFAHPSLCLYKLDERYLWPLGTASYCVSYQANSTINCVSNEYHRGLFGRPTSENLIFHIRPERDPRDFISSGDDILLLQDQRLLEYVSFHPEFRAIPLPWNRIYLFASPLLPGIKASEISEREEPNLELTTWLGSEFVDLQKDLAQFIVRSSAIPANVHTYPEMRKSKEADRQKRNGGTESQPGTGGWEQGLHRTTHIVYPENDLDARLIAERFAGLASPRRISNKLLSGSTVSRLLQSLFSHGPRTPSSSLGLSAGVFHARLVLGLDSAYIFPLRCRLGAPDVLDASAAGLMNGTWMGSSGDKVRTMLPLINCRSHLIVRNSLCGIYTNYFGTVVFAGTGWKEGRP